MHSNSCFQIHYRYTFLKTLLTLLKENSGINVLCMVIYVERNILYSISYQIHNLLDIFDDNFTNGTCICFRALLYLISCNIYIKILKRSGHVSSIVMHNENADFLISRYSIQSQCIGWPIMVKYLNSNAKQRFVGQTE